MSKAKEEQKYAEGRGGEEDNQTLRLSVQHSCFILGFNFKSEFGYESN
jgi:hypothetical protein